jgi:hypothetical protein
LSENEFLSFSFLAIIFAHKFFIWLDEWFFEQSIKYVSQSESMFLIFSIFNPKELIAILKISLILEFC